MKSIRIDVETHQLLTELKTRYYKKTGRNPTFSEVLKMLIDNDEEMLDVLSNVDVGGG